MNEIRFNNPVTEEVATKPESEQVSSKKRNWGRIFRFSYWWQKIKNFKVLLVIFLLIVLVSLGITANFYFEMKKAQSVAQLSASEDIQKTIKEVSKLILLPENEEPTVATIQDREKLDGQPFFNNAKNGDKVLIYSVARKAVLYDPIRKIILEVAPLNIDAPGESP